MSTKNIGEMSNKIMGEKTAKIWLRRQLSAYTKDLSIENLQYAGLWAKSKVAGEAPADDGVYLQDKLFHMEMPNRVL